MPSAQFSLPTGLTTASVVVGLQCYVCVPRTKTNNTDVLHIFPKFPANLTCEDFTNNNYRYIRDCPNNYSSCIMVTDGSKVTRSCNELPVNDCKMANHVEYCYCKDSLCNGARAARHPVPATLPPPHPSDDEDLEGSGGGPVDNRKSLLTTTLPAAATTRSAVVESAASLHRTVPLALLATATSIWAR